MSAHPIACSHCTRTWLNKGIVLLLVASTSCGGGDGAAPDPVPPGSERAFVTVKVVDALGFAKTGAAVSLADGTGSTGTTGPDGQTLVELPADRNVLLQVNLTGHTRQFRPLRVAAGSTAYLKATLLQRAPALTLPDAAAGGTLVGKNAARLTLPEGALVDAVTGAAVSGAVQVEMTPVNTSSHEAGAFPGSMRAISGDTEGQLVTYGPVEYIFTRDGRRLQLAPGKTAEIEMPLHATLDVDGTPLEVGETMPVWSLDETTGIWRQEGEGTVVASASATGLALRATVTHFSWWNPDHFRNARQVRISFVVEDGVIPTACCDVEGLTTPGFDGPSGIASTTLPIGGGTVVVDTPSLYIFTALGLSEQGPLFGGVLDVLVPEGDSPFDLTITLTPDPDTPNPIITSPEAGVTAYTRDTQTVLVSVSGDEPDLVELRVFGQIVGPMVGSQENGYAFDWDTTDLVEGEYEIDVRVTRGESVLISGPRTVVVDRTQPQVVGRAPEPDFLQTTPDVVVVATFNEPIDPASLATPEDPAELRTELRRGGLPTDPLVPAAVALSEDGRRLSLTPLESLTTGASYGVFIAGLRDRAGNTMAPDAWGFSVPLFAVAGPDLTVLDDVTKAIVVGRPALALDGSDQPVVAWTSAVDNEARIQVRRLVGPLWVSLPPLIVTAPLDPNLSMVLDPAGQPIVAWTQNTPNTPLTACTSIIAIQLFVARFNGSTWDRLGDGDLNADPCSQPRRPRLARDLAGRPVLVASEGAGSRTLRVQRFGGSAWELLGVILPRSPSATASVVGLSLALQDNLPLVLVSESRGGPIDHFVSRLDNGVAEPLGPLIATGNVSDLFPALEMDGFGRAVVALPLTFSEMRVFRFDGSWVPLGGPLTAGVGATQPSIVFGGSEPRVTYRGALTSPVFTQRYDGTLDAWSDPVTVLNQAGNISDTARAQPTGPTWVAASTGPFNGELRVFRADALP